jgi:hypothetical protein
MTPDLINLIDEDLDFDEPLPAEVEQCLNQAAAHPGRESSEIVLMRAYFLAPEHPVVLIALYRHFFHRHRLSDALRITERLLRILARRLGLPEDWHDLDEPRLGSGILVSMTWIRLYLLALKAAGYLEMRLGDYGSARTRLQKVAEFDTGDRLGTQALLAVIRAAFRTETDAASA